MSSSEDKQHKKTRYINSVSTAGSSGNLPEVSVLTDAPFIPQDTGNFAYMIVTFQGLANLFPWNAFITASGYFSTRFCGTPYDTSFEAYFSFAATAFQTVGLALSVVYQERFSLHSRIIYPLLMYGVIFAVTTLLVLAKKFDGDPLFWTTIVSVTLSGICGAVLSGGLFSMSAVFPPSYTAALMTGQALAGVVVSSSDMLTSIAGKQPENFCSTAGSGSNSTSTGGSDEQVSCHYDVNYSAFAYFLIATIVLLTSAALQYLLMKLPFTVYHMRRQGWNWLSSELSERISVAYQAVTTTDKDRLLLDPLLRYFAPAAVSRSVSASSTSAVVLAADMGFESVAGGGATSSSRRIDPSGQGAYNPLATSASSSHSSHSPAGNFKSLNEEVSTAISFHESRLRRDPSLDRQGTELQASVEMGGISFPTILRVGRSVGRPAFAAMFCFVVTLAVFPALTVFLRSEHQCEYSGRIFNDLYVPLYFLLYNSGDFCGRVIAGWYQIFNGSNIIYPALARIVFIPLFLLCNNDGSQLPVVFESDGWPITFMLLMAFSNGYVASSAMMIGPSLVDNRDKNLAGTIMIFCLTLGLMLGSVLSFSVVEISQGKV